MSIHKTPSSQRGLDLAKMLLLQRSKLELGEHLEAVAQRDPGFFRAVLSAMPHATAYRLRAAARLKKRVIDFVRKSIPSLPESERAAFDRLESHGAIASLQELQHLCRTPELCWKLYIRAVELAEDEEPKCTHIRSAARELKSGGEIRDPRTMRKEKGAALIRGAYHLLRAAEFGAKERRLARDNLAEGLLLLGYPLQRRPTQK